MKRLNFSIAYILILFFLLTLSISASYYRYVVKEDFIFFLPEAGTEDGSIDDVED